jgi:uncharacterized protein (DUF1786 family)
MGQMSRYLILDVGAGTLDLLYYDESAGEHFKAVIKSPVRTLANDIENLRGDLVVTGVEMGGGRVSSVLKKRAQSDRVVMSVEAAATVHHDPDRVASFGIVIVPDEEARALAVSPGYTHIALADIEPERIRRIVEGLGVPFRFDIIGVCAQDHGVAPRGISHLDFRHRLFASVLDRSPFPHALVYPGDHVPATFNRLRCIARTALKMPADEIYVMDSGMAAIQGACSDPLCRGLKRFMVLDIATSHTVGAAITEGEIAGFFEYHTHGLTVEKLDRLLREFPGGKISHAQILSEGGHGAYTRRRFDYRETEIIIATGPRRTLMTGSRLPLANGAPWGDNMMTGTVGTLEAIRKYKAGNHK